MSKPTSQENKMIGLKNKLKKIIKIDDAHDFLQEYNAIELLLTNYQSVREDMLLSITDPDCRIMKSDGTTKECYNAQIVSNNQLIVAAEMTQDENDQAQLNPMINQLKKNISLDENKIITLAADAGYNRGKNLKEIDQDKNIDAYFSMYDRLKRKNKNKQIYKENFIYDEDDDSWKCPQGKKLDFVAEFIQAGKKYTRYGCTLTDCINCPQRNKCVTTKDDTKRGYRTIEDDGYIVYRQEMISKMQEAESKKIYAERAGIVEPVFGQIKYNKKFSRFKLKGLKKVSSEFLTMALVHNIGKILKHTKLNQTIA